MNQRPEPFATREELRLFTVTVGRFIGEQMAPYSGLIQRIAELGNKITILEERISILKAAQTNINKATKASKAVKLLVPRARTVKLLRAKRQTNV